MNYSDQMINFLKKKLCIIKIFLSLLTLQMRLVCHFTISFKDTLFFTKEKIQNSLYLRLYFKDLRLQKLPNEVPIVLL